MLEWPILFEKASIDAPLSSGGCPQIRLKVWISNFTPDFSSAIRLIEPIPWAGAGMLTALPPENVAFQIVHHDDPETDVEVFDVRELRLLLA